MTMTTIAVTHELFHLHVSAVANDLVLVAACPIVSQVRRQRVIVGRRHAFFGEQSFFARTAAATTVKAGTYCELMLLAYDAFTHIAAHFPDLEEHMRRCRGEVNDAWQDCFFLGTTPSRGQQRRGPATW